MPRLSCWLIRSALIHFGIGITFGSLMLWNKGVPIHPMLWLLLPAHMEFLLIGWTVQLFFGVAYWILPRFQSQRGKTQWVWLAFALINLGVWLVASASFLPLFPLLTLIGRCCEASALLVFVLSLWPRIKPVAF